MKKMVIGMMVLTLLGVLSAPPLRAGDVESRYGEQLLSNPGFEDSTGDMRYWRTDQKHAPIRVMLVEGEGGKKTHGGNRAIKLIDIPDGKTSTFSSTETVEVKPGERVLGSIWAKGKGKMAIGLFPSQAGKTLRAVGSPRLDLTDKWQELKWLYTVPEGIESVTFTILLSYEESDTGWHAIVDDASARKFPTRATTIGDADDLPGQLLRNPSFEDAEGAVTGWRVMRTSPVTVTVIELTSEEEIRSGGTSIKLVDVLDGQTGVFSCTEAIGVKPGENIISGVWAKGKGKIMLGVFPANQEKTLRAVSSPKFDLTDKWQELTWTYTVPDGIERVTFTLLLYYEESDTDCYAIVDDAFTQRETESVAPVETAEAVPGQILLNPGFEDAADAVAGWSVSRYAPLTVTVIEQHPEEDIHSGGRSVKLVDVPDEKTGGFSWAESIDVKPGDRIISGIWAKGKGKVYIGFGQYFTGKWVRTRSSPMLTLTDEWQPINWTYVAPENVDRAEFYILLPHNPDDPDAFVIVDDASARKLLSRASLKGDADSIPGQLLANPSFEDAADAVAGWLVSRYAPLTVTVIEQHPEEDIHSGGTSIKLVDPSDGRTGSISSAKPIDVKPGETVYYGVWAKGRGKIYMGVFPATAEKRLRVVSSPMSDLTDEWQELKWTYTVKEGIEQVTFLILMCYNEPADTGGRAIVSRRGDMWTIHYGQPDLGWYAIIDDAYCVKR